MKNNKLLVISTIICLLPIALGIALYDKLPDEIITHWDTNGLADGYSGKNFAVFGLPVIMAGLNLIIHFQINNDPKYERIGKMPVMIGKFIVPVLSLLMVSLSVIYSIEDYRPRVSVTQIVLALVSVFIVLYGNYLPKCRQNYTVGIKLPWTLNDEYNWNKTHKFAGYIWTAVGVIMFIASILNKVNIYVFVAVIVIISALPAGYSYILYRKSKINNM